MSEDQSFGEKWTPILMEIEQAFWEREINLPGTPHGFPPKALLGAGKILTTILLDLMWAKNEKKGTPQATRCEEATYMGESLHALIKQCTDIDIKELMQKELDNPLP